MSSVYLIPLFLIVVNAVVSYRGLRNGGFLDAYRYEVESILQRKEYYRLLTGTFLHISWSHLIFNIITLWIFSPALVAQIGVGFYLILYAAGAVGGSLLSLFLHKNHPHYVSVGASGAVCALVFSSIALFPGLTLGLFFLPLQIPAWLFGILYVVFSIYGIRSENHSIGHDAHLGGGLSGMLLAIMIRPGVLLINYVPILCVLVPSVVFIYIMLRKPHLLWYQPGFLKPKNKAYTLEDKYNAGRKEKEEELDDLLDKVARKGLQGLSERERRRLEELSKM
jgi:membrane associated rhomboid family serine protease